MQKNIARIGHLNFRSSGELNNFAKRYSEDAPAFSQEALELKLITTSAESVVVIGIYKNSEEAERVLERLQHWLAQFSEIYEQSFYLVGDVEFSYQSKEE